MTDFIPWIEKYRPQNFEDIVLDDVNKKLFKGILDINRFPNILLYGPPGTGKTTTIINIINKYQENNNQQSKQLKIHLNASDERGIDIIRLQISQFVQSKSLFVNGTKFVVLDEVDYMTKNAQIALKQLMQNYTENVTFCLICNYISKIDQALQNEFLKIRFNQLPQDRVFEYIKNISLCENLKINDETINDIQKIFKSDMRSMINYLQTNERTLSIRKKYNIISNEKWNIIYNEIKNSKEICKYINNLSEKYCIDKRDIILKISKIHLNNCSNSNIIPFLEFTEKLIHNYDNYYSLNYFSEKFVELFQ